MTSQPHTSAMGAQDRPAPSHGAALSEYAAAAPFTYVPEEYDAQHVPMVVTGGAGQFGLVRPKQRTGRAVWVVLLLIIGSVGGFVALRVVHTGSAPPPGIAFTSAKGHFAVRFVQQPIELDRSVRDGHTRLVTHIAAVPGQGAVAEMEIIGPVPSDPSQLFQRLGASLGGSAEITLTDVKKFRFQGNPAQQGNYIESTSGDLVSALLVVPTQRRLYFVLGLTGPVFDGLKASFRALP